MPFPWTLQRYIFREMGKTFLLTAVALTGVLGLGGGVLQMVEFGEVTPGQLLRLMALILPIAAALTLPIAALFSAAATYGRLSADNEFVACRASGINLHVLLLPTLVLSLASAVVTFVLINFLIPGMVRNLNEFIATDVGVLIHQRLNRPKGITLGGRYRIYAEHSESDPADGNRVLLTGIAFVEVDGEEWVRYGTARQVRLAFDRNAARVRAAGTMAGLSFFDRRAGRFADLAEQTIPPNELPYLLPLQIKFLTLGELFHYWANPGLWGHVVEAMSRLRAGVLRSTAYDAMLDDLNDDKQMILSDASVSYTVRAAQAARIPREGGIELTDVTIDEDRQGRRRSYAAGRAVVEVLRGEATEPSGVRIEGYEVRVRDGGRTFERPKETLDPIAVPPAILKRVEGLSDDELLRPNASQAADHPTAQRREAARHAFADTGRRIIATLSERMAFTISVFVLVILGAVLGIVFRGAHVLVAFGISFVPSLLVILTIVMGKQMAHNAHTQWPGLLLMWGGIALVALLDGWTLTKVLRR